MKPGWTTTENAQTAGAGGGILYALSEALGNPALSWQHAAVLCVGCASLAWVVTHYAKSRSEAKKGAQQ